MIRRTLLSAALGALALANTHCSPQPDPTPKIPTCDHVGDICTFAGTGTAGFNKDDIPALQADLYLPMDLVFGPDKNAYIVDWNNHRIRQVLPDGSKIHTVAGSGELGDDTNDQIQTETSFNHPTSAAFDGQGRLVIAAWHNSRLKRLDVATGKLENIAGVGKRSYSGDGGPADKAAFDLPTSVAFDADGNLFLMDQANQMIRKIDSTNTVSRVAGNCIIGECAAEQEALQCTNSARKACATPDTLADACTGACAIGFAGDGGSALDARLAMPVGQAADPGGRLTLDKDGNIYFADTRNHRIREITKADGNIKTIAGTGEAGFSGEGGPATQAKLDKPVDIEVGPDGAVYFADTGNSCIRAITADGNIKTVAGQCGQRGADGDGGPATKATLDHPYGIAFDANGDLYIADTENSRVRRVRLK